MNAPIHNNTLLSKYQFAIIVLFAIGIAFRIWLIFALPYGQTVSHRLEGLNDEPAHFNYILYLKDHKSFPVQTHSVKDTGSFLRGDFEYYQPPLYYCIGSVITSICPSERAGLLWCRAFSCLLGLATIVLTGLTIKRITRSTSYGVAGALFATFMLVHAYFSSLVSNDSLSWFLASLLTYILIILAQQPQWTTIKLIKTSLICGFLCGASLLTKSSMLPFFILAIAVVASLGLYRKDFRYLIGAVLIALVGSVLAFPWYFRNYTLYDSILALTIGFGEPDSIHHSLSWFAHLLYATTRFFIFPMQHIASSVIWKILVLVGIIGIATITLFAVVKTIKDRLYSLSYVICWGILAITIAGYIKLNATWGEPEGRFLLPALIPIILVALLGISSRSEAVLTNKVALRVGLLLIVYQSAFFFLA